MYNLFNVLVMKLILVHKALENVSAQSIANWFRTCCFIKDGQTIGEGIPVQDEEVEVLLST